MEDFESKPRKTVAFSSVSHFNVVHAECHLAAVRLARTREEWDTGTLQNANTRCNGLLPIWGPQVAESLFAQALARYATFMQYTYMYMSMSDLTPNNCEYTVCRHNTYIQECTGVRDATYTFSLHDIKHMLVRFAFERSFSEDSGGGGRQSNMHALPHFMHAALYAINT